MSNSNLVAFRLPAELQTVFNDAVTTSGSDKTSWIVSAIKEKLNRPEGNPDARMLTLVERMESASASLIAGKAWDKDIYSAWKQHKNIAGKLS
ncbi:hypothetical protein ACOJ0Y_07170 [Morganella morganii]|uniref:hypothetical protein n=1 Tax=Morganella morganii TaxID=582 RepID=UPI001BD99013|nr:hypothetical protein [Morganella morganii]EKU4001241.1 hypothetical protein [Morganella morganii]MBT0405528.1 hypothetical protein [Morganella morganii subsp. morganii]MBT0424436.1 hypothetical protein [Morganella morganii subsp. morganii]MBT0471581.1 hypothetical protein [Morganella morganii subsp. morganii]QWL99461.1 hypothetical protein IZ188_12770 [Morganella morganii subsp. morganii]